MTTKNAKAQVVIFVLAVLCLCFAGAVTSIQAQSEWTTSGTNISNANSGNVGIGTSSPNAKLVIATGTVGLGTNSFTSWTQHQSVLESLNTSIFFGQVTDLHFNSNAYHNNGWKYRENGASSNYYLYGGQHYWRVAGSGTAGNLIQWIDAMNLTNAGNLGLGTNTPTTLQGGYTGLAGRVFQLRNTDGVAQMNISAGSSSLATLGFEVTNATSTKRFFQQIYDGANNVFKFRTLNESTAAVTQDNILVLKNNGDVGIGASPNYRLDVQGGQINTSVGLCIAGDCKTSWSQVGGSQWATSGTTINYSTGNVGIATSTPTEKLHVTGNVKASGTLDGAGGLCIGGDCKSAWSQVGSSQWATSGTTINYSTGNVGIATSTPTEKLHVTGNVKATGNVDGGGLCIGGDCKSAWSQISTQWTTTGATINYSTGNVGIATTTPTEKLHVTGNVKATGNLVGGALCIGADCKSAWSQISTQWTTTGATINYSTGNVGIATSTPTEKLHVTGNVKATGNVDGGGLCIGGDCKSAWSQVGSSQWATTGSTINYSTGNVGIATSTPTEKLHVTGNVKVTGNIDVGGNINAKYQDMAEWVDSSQELVPGTVVVLDTTKNNQVVASTQAYDSRVAGVISLNPGLRLGEAAEGRVLVATTGRVKVKVDATKGAIQIGDLLVTGEVEGYAIKSVPVEIGGVRIHRPGTLIGKALEPLSGGKGEILVLLSLQ